MVVASAYFVTRVVTAMEYLLLIVIAVCKICDTIIALCENRKRN